VKLIHSTPSPLAPEVIFAYNKGEKDEGSPRSSGTEGHAKEILIMGMLEGKVAIVTGGNSGIGKATVELFRKEGALVTLVARREEVNRQVAEEFGADYITGDVTDPATATKVAVAVYAKYGRIDILVNDAGQPDGTKSAKNCTNEFWQAQIDVNLNGAFYMCREVLRYMEPVGAGSIINVSSIGGVYHCAGAAYSAAKAGLIGLTHNLAIQYCGTDIRCNCVCPGATKTPLFDPDRFGDMDVEMSKITAKHIRKGLPMCSAMDQANAILFFASDMGKSVTGQYLVVDKGMCI
jgi:NAD(P)-dependent dehydrogenase (short-subunit alcohol dehydrogenase family)